MNLRQKYSRDREEWQKTVKLFREEVKSVLISSDKREKVLQYNGERKVQTNLFYTGAQDCAKRQRKADDNRPAYIGWPTGNGKKLSNCQACCLAQLCMGAA